MVQNRIVVNEKYTEVTGPTITTEIHIVRRKKSWLDRTLSESNGVSDWLHYVDNYNRRIFVGPWINGHFIMVRNQRITAEWVSGSYQNGFETYLKKEASCFDHSGCALSRYSGVSSIMWVSARFQMAHAVEVLLRELSHFRETGASRAVLWLLVFGSDQ